MERGVQATMSAAEDLQFAASDLLSQRAEMMKRAKILGFVPHAKQLDFIMHDTVKRKGMVGANRGGKTTTIVTEASCHSWGCRPFFPKDHPNFRVLGTDGKPIRVPNLGIIAGEDFPVGIGEVLWRSFLKWIPPDSYRVTKTERGVPRQIKFDISWCPWADKSDPLYPNSVIDVHAYKAGRESFQGMAVDWILADEPPPEDVYEEMMRALLDLSGKWMGAMTVAQQSRAWIYDLFMPPKKRTGTAGAIDARLGSAFRSSSYYLVPLSTWDNVKSPNGSGGLNPKDIEEFAAGFDDPDKVDLRVHGKPIHLMGTEYGKDWEPEIHIVPDRERDPEACYLCCCDAHPTKPFAILWFEINEHDEWHVWSESYDEHLDTLWMVSDHMKTVEGWKPLVERVSGWDEKRSITKWIQDSGPYLSQVRYIDPLADMKQKQGDGLSDIDDFAINHGIYWRKWNRGNLAARIRTVKDWLRPGKGPKAKPKLTFAESCVEIAFQMPRFREKMPKQPTEQPRTGMFVDVDADLVQCVIAAANCGLNYQMLHQLKGTGAVRNTEVYRQTDERIRPSAGYMGRWGEQKQKDEIELSWGRR